MREALALFRAAALTAASYRVGMVVSLVGLAAVVIPLYFIAHALQPAMAATISSEAPQYFAYVVVGAMTFSLITACTVSLPGAVEAAVGRGTLEMMLATPARLPAVVLGLMSYGITWAVLRAAIVLLVAVALGSTLFWRAAPVGMVILAMTMLSYVGIGLMLGALVLVFRTSGPLAPVVLTGSMLLGGVYYPARVVPDWLRSVGEMLPLTYGLRALRQVLLRGDGLDAVAGDLMLLGGWTTVLLAAGSASLVLALGRARRDGTLASY